MHPRFLFRCCFTACLGSCIARGTAELISVDDSVADGSHVALLQQHAELARSMQDWGRKPKKVAAVYMASGQKYVLAAFTAASSLRQSLKHARVGVDSMPNVQIVLYTDEPLANDVPSAPFDSVNTEVISGLVEKFQQKKAALRASKIHSIKHALASHDYVIYLDSDTLVCSPHLIFGIMSALDMGAHIAGVPELATRDWKHLDKSGDVHIPVILPSSVTIREINGGMLGVRSSGESRDLFQLWADYHWKSYRMEECVYENESERGRDQKPLMCALNASTTSIAYMSGGYNCKSINNYGINSEGEKTEWYETKTYCGMENDVWSTEFNASGLMSTQCYLIHGSNTMQGWNFDPNH